MHEFVDSIIFFCVLILLLFLATFGTVDHNSFTLKPFPPLTPMKLMLSWFPTASSFSVFLVTSVDFSFYPSHMDIT